MAARLAATGLRRARPIVIAAAGLPLVTFPRQVGALVAGAARPDPRIVWLLGARMVGQGVALLVRPSTAMWRLGSAVDAAHGTSMVGLAVLSRRYRRPAVISAAVAATSAWLEIASVRTRTS